MHEHEVTAQPESGRKQSEVAHDGMRDKKANHGKSGGTPWWVIGFAIVFVLGILVLVIMHLTGNGFANHMSMGLSIPEGWLQNL